MKKYFILSTFAWAALIAFIACNKEKTPVSLDENVGTIELIINAGSPETKTVFGENTGSGYPLTWAETGEAIKLVEILTPDDEETAASSKAYTSSGYTLSDGNTKASFSTSIDELTTEGTYDYRAIYPASVFQSASLQYNDLYVKIPDSQTPAANSPDASATVLYAEALGYTTQPTSSMDLAFKHVTAYGKMTIKNASDAFGDASEDISSVSISVPAGGIYYYWNTGDIASVSATKKDAVIIKTDNLDTSDDFVAWFTCAPYSLAIGDVLTVSVTTTANTYTRDITMSKAMTFESGKVSKFSVDMSSASAAGDISGNYLIVSTDGTNPWHVMTYDVSNNFYLGESTGVTASTKLDINDASTNFGNYCVSSNVWVLAKVSGGYSLKNVFSDKYVTLNNDSNNAHATTSPVALTVTDTGEGVYTIKENKYSRNLQFNYNNGNNPRFAFYSSSQKALTFIPVSSYKLQLATPSISNATASGSTINISWGASPNASSYKVTCTGQTDKSIPYGTNSASFTGLADGAYTVTVTAIGDGTTYANSAPASATVTVAGSSSTLEINLSSKELWDSFDANSATMTTTIGTILIEKNGSSTNVSQGITDGHTRIYQNAKLTITPAQGVNIKGLDFTATSDTYATNLKNATWTNATASASTTAVAVTPTVGTTAIVAVMGSQTRVTKVVVTY
jgi:hypothetical protein